jgi:hypothetical protein
VNVILNVAKFTLDAIIVPALEWPAEVHADHLAKHSGINPLKIRVIEFDPVFH